MQTVVWTLPNNTMSQDNTFFITFDPLRASNSGQYKCKGSIASPVLDIPAVNEDIFNLTVTCKNLT